MVVVVVVDELELEELDELELDELELDELDELELDELELEELELDELELDEVESQQSTQSQQVLSPMSPMQACEYVVVFIHPQSEPKSSMQFTHVTPISQSILHFGV